MKIIMVAIGNSVEAFIESRFTGGLNIMSSDDNNKGKTIVIQSMMYAFGNEPAFPSSFPYSEYGYVVTFEHNDVMYTIARKADSFVIKYNQTLAILDSIAELKRYWHRNIFELPIIFHKGVERIVDPVLFLQLFFIGQDKKDTSNIANNGWYNKSDFYNMLFSYAKIACVATDTETIEAAKAELDRLIVDKSDVFKQYKVLKSKKKSVAYLSAINDRDAFQRTIDELSKARDRIAELRKERNRAASRKSMWETTLLELRSLNRTIEHGELRCMECNSTHITYSGAKKESYSFDVSTVQMRNSIIESIREQIEIYAEEIDRITATINNQQESIKQLLSENDVSIESIVLMKNDILNAEDAEKEIERIEARISELNAAIETHERQKENAIELQKQLLESIVQRMKTIYQILDPCGNLTLNDLFTTRGKLYSGSEATIFHLLRLYSLCTVLEHPYPIVIDSFRAEDLSTEKERIALNLFSSLPNQVILTTTLKQEEVGKYAQMPDVTNIDYAVHQPSKLLSAAYVAQYLRILESIGLTT